MNFRDHYERFDDWVNADVYKRIRRIDIALLIFGIICVSWYGYKGGWRGAILGLVAYLVMMYVGMFFRNTSGPR